jgi:hypothetical protein
MWKLVRLNEFTLDWLNYLDKKHIDQIMKPISGRKKGERLGKAEIGAKVFKEMARLCKITEMVQEKTIKVHFVQFIMYFFKLENLENLKEISYEFS